MTSAPDAEPRGIAGDPTTRRCDGCGGLYTAHDPPDKHAKCASAATQPPITSQTVPFVELTSRPISSGPTDVTLKAPQREAESDIPSEVRQAALNAQNLLNQYVLVKQLGKGGMGTVWKAFDRTLLRWVAVKFLHSGDDESVRRFRREAQLAARLRHPNIAPIYEVGEGRGQHFIAMEFIDGASLDKLNLPLPAMLELFAKVCAGVEAAHKGGVVHRDLKPQNIMVTQDGWPYVMDFGLAKALQTESSLSMSGAIMGTPAYMPPEQAQGKLPEIDSRSDVYSLGATLYALLTRAQPYQGTTAMEILVKVCKEDFPPPRKLDPTIPPPVEAIIVKAMAREKKDRYESAAAMAADIQRYLAGGPVEARAPGSIHVLARKAKRHGWPIAAGAALLLAIGAASFVVLRPSAPGPNPKNGAAADEKAKREETWLRRWKELRDRIAFSEWNASDASIGPVLREHLARMAQDVSVGEADDVERWLDDQIEKARESPDRDRAVAWGDLLARTAETIPALAKIRSRAQQIAATPPNAPGPAGTFTLKIAPAPYARVERIRCKDRELPLTQRDTPLVLRDLEIGDYAIELSHPTLGRSTLEIPADRMKDGGTYRVGGPVQQPRWIGTP